MTIADVLCHQWRQRWCSTTWSRHLVEAILLVVAAAYVGLLFVVALTQFENSLLRAVWDWNAGLVVLGIATAPLWTRWIGEVLCRQRHVMAAGFRAADP
jgi:hypothetical protein